MLFLSHMAVDHETSDDIGIVQVHTTDPWAMPSMPKPPSALGPRAKTGPTP